MRSKSGVTLREECLTLWPATLLLNCLPRVTAPLSGDGKTHTFKTVGNNDMHDSGHLHSAKINDYLRSYSDLRLFFECWDQARGKENLPTKDAFISKMLTSPEIIPNLVILKIGVELNLTYIFIGSEIVKRRELDHTNLTYDLMHDEKNLNTIRKWVIAGLMQPHINFHTMKTLLPSGRIAESNNLSAFLTDQSGMPTFLAVQTVVDERFKTEAHKGKYSVGSIDLKMRPIDIGFGVPSLPTAA